MRTLPLLLLALAAPAALGAQALPAAELPAGTRVRVWAPARAEGVVRGTVWSVTADTLFVGDDYAIRAALHVPAIERLDVSRGRTVPTLVAAGAGALVFGALGDYGSRLADRPAPPPQRRVTEVAATASVGALLGAVLGSAFGERWSRVYPLESPVQDDFSRDP